MKSLFVFLALFLAIVLIIGKTPTPDKFNTSVEIYSLDNRWHCEDLKAWSILFPVSDSLASIEDIESDGIVNMQQFMFFAEQENVAILNPSIKSFNKHKRGPQKFMTRFIFCTDSLVTEEQLRKIVEKAL